MDVQCLKYLIVFTFDSKSTLFYSELPDFTRTVLSVHTKK